MVLFIKQLLITSARHAKIGAEAKLSNCLVLNDEGVIDERPACNMSYEYFISLKPASRPVQDRPGRLG